MMTTFAVTLTLSLDIRHQISGFFVLLALQPIFFRHSHLALEFRIIVIHGCTLKSQFPFTLQYQYVVKPNIILNIKCYGRVARILRYFCYKNQSQLPNYTIEIITIPSLQFLSYFMVFSFLQRRRCHPVTRCIKKLLTSPVIMKFFI